MLMAIPETKENDVLTDAALKCGAFGWHVFPCKPKDKAPLISGGFTNASTEPAQIKAWWKAFPNALIGIACGASHIVVLDYDPDKDPDLKGAQLCKEFTEGVQTREARSGRGGHHWYFEMPGAEPIRNSSSDLGPGVDIRGDGGYVIAPPSVSEFGPYRWLNQTRLSPTPHRLRTAIRKMKEEPAPSSTGGGGTPLGGQIPEGKRNETLFRDACAMRRRGMSPVSIERAIEQENRDRCDPPLTDEQAREAARSALRYEPEAGPVVAPANGEVLCDLTAEDAVRVMLSVGNNVGAAFSFTEMEKAKRELNTTLEITISGDPDSHLRRINIESSSAEESLRRYLKGMYSDYDWQRILNRVFSAARKTFLNQDRGLDASLIPRSIGMPQDLIAPFMPLDGATVLFGDGGSLKSYTSLGLAIAGLTKQAAAGRYDVPDCGVMYIDYEADPAKFGERFDRVLLGMGVQAPPGLIYWRGGGVPLPDQTAAIAHSCDRNSVGWIIVDSVGVAAGDDLVEQQTVSRFFAALQKIGRPSLLIAHISKGREVNTKYPFGSVYWSNFARRTWYTKATEDESDERRIRLECKKNNDGPWPKPQNLLVTFEGSRGPVRVKSTTQPVDTMTVKQHLWAVLDRPKTKSQIALETGIDEATVDNALRRNSEMFTSPSSEPAQPGRGRAARLWARLSKIEEVPF